MATITILKRPADKGEIVVISKKAPDARIARAGKPVTEKDILRWSRQAKKLYRSGKLHRLS